MPERIAVIDTETTYYDDVMSIGIVIANREDLSRQKTLYYVFPEQCGKPAMFGSALFVEGQEVIRMCRQDALREIDGILKEWNVTMIFAYNALFDKGHLPELTGYVWRDIMKLAAYRQYNPYIPESYDMTLEAVITKTMWILGRTRERDRFRELFYTSINHDLLFLPE